MSTVSLGTGRPLGGQVRRKFYGIDEAVDMMVALDVEGERVVEEVLGLSGCMRRPPQLATLELAEHGKAFLSTQLELGLLVVPSIDCPSGILSVGQEN